MHYETDEWMSARVETIIACPISIVFPFVVDPVNDSQWMSGISQARQLTPGPIQIGTRFQQYAIGPLGRAEVFWKVVEYDENRRILGRSYKGAYEFDGGHEFEAVDLTTKVIKFASFRRVGMLRMIPISLGAGLMRSYFEQWLRCLSLLMERRSGADK